LPPAYDEPSCVPDQTKAFTHMATPEQQTILSWLFVGLKNQVCFRTQFYFLRLIIEK
jgi:hypothetical protein